MSRSLTRWARSPEYLIAGLGAKTASQPEAVGCAPSLARPLWVHCVRPNSLPVNLPQRICTQQGASGESGCRHADNYQEFFAAQPKA